VDGEVTYVRTTLGREYAEEVLGRETAVGSRLAELERLRTDFVATIAHELKTPLTAIRTCVGLLTDSDARADAEVQQRLLARVATSTDGMQHLIESLLDLARYRAGSVQLEPRWVDAVEVARDAIGLVSPLLEQRSQQVRLDAPEDALTLYADRRRLVQALGNILSNAQKYSPVGAMIDVTVRRTDDDPAYVAWDVRDEGPGISEADQRHLFERFFRGRSDIEGGSGLGLPIALATAQAHEGSISVVSELGHGSTFTLTIPVGEDSAGEDGEP
jgi:signal transduction histidine kinase